MVIEIEDLQTGHGIDCSHNVYQHRILGGAMDANESLDVGEDKLTRIELREEKACEHSLQAKEH